MSSEKLFFTQDNLTLLRSLSYYLIFLPIVISIWRVRHLRDVQWMILLIVIVNLINESISRLIFQQGVNNLWIFHIYVPLVFYLTTKLYSHRRIGILSKKQFKYVFLLFLTVNLINTAIFQPLDSFNSNSVSLASSVYMILSIVFFYRMLRKSEDEFILSRPIVWFNIGTLLYYSATFLLFMVVEQIISNRSDILIAAWVLNALFYCVLNVCYSVALWIKSQH